MSKFERRSRDTAFKARVAPEALRELATVPTWLSTCPFSRPDARVQATGSTR